MMNTTKVIPVRSSPALENPVFVKGIRDRAAAERWAVRNGHSMVWFIAHKEMVYAERLLQATEAEPAQLSMELS